MEKSYAISLQALKRKQKKTENMDKFTKDFKHDFKNIYVSLNSDMYKNG